MISFCAWTRAIARQWTCSGNVCVCVVYFISGAIAASQGLAWAIILTFMSQVSLMSLLRHQMAGLTEVGSICCYIHCSCYLFYFLLPIDVPCAVIAFVQCYLPFQMWMLFQNSQLFHSSWKPDPWVGSWLDKLSQLPSIILLKYHFYNVTLIDHPAL